MGLLSSCLSLPPRPSPGINDLDKNSRQNLDSMRLIRKLLSRRGLTPVVVSQLSAVSAARPVALTDCRPLIALPCLIALLSLENVVSSLISSRRVPVAEYRSLSTGCQWVLANFALVQRVASRQRRRHDRSGPSAVPNHPAKRNRGARRGPRLQDSDFLLTPTQRLTTPTRAKSPQQMQIRRLLGAPKKAARFGDAGKLLG